MSDMSSMNRENKKRQLRQQIVRPQQQPAPAESEEAQKAGRRKKRRRRLKIFVVVLITAAVGAVGVAQFIKYYRYTDYSVVWERPMNEGSFVGYENFAGNVIKYTKDGASYIDAQGKDIWVEPYEMKSPIVSVNGGFAAVADQQGNRILVFDKAGRQGEITTLLPIIRVSISAHGVVAAVMEDATASYVSMYKTDGTELLTFMCLVDGKTGYPMDISLSPDGAQLIGAYAYLKNGMNGRVAFHNFSEIGKNIPSRVVGGFDEMYESGMVVRVKFLTDTYSCAFADDSISFFSTKNMASPELIKLVPVEEEIQSVFYSDRYVGIIVSNMQGENPSRMDIYRNNGEKVFSREFRYQYRRAEIDGEHVILYNENSCEVYNMSGVLKFSGAFDFTISKVRNGRFPDTLILTGPQIMREIRLK